MVGITLEPETASQIRAIAKRDGIYPGDVVVRAIDLLLAVDHAAFPESSRPLQAERRR